MSEAHPGSGAERRAFIRYLPTTELPRQVILGAVQQRWHATVRDISRSGIGLTFSKPIEAGTLGEVELQTMDHATRTLRVKVIYAREQEDGSWQLGCAFLQQLSDEELKKLL